MWRRLRKRRANEKGGVWGSTYHRATKLQPSASPSQACGTRALHACTGRMKWKGDGEKMTKGGSPSASQSRRVRRTQKGHMSTGSGWWAESPCRGNTLHARGLTQLSCWKCPQLNIRPNQLGIRKKWAGIRKDQGEGVGSGRGTP